MALADDRRKWDARYREMALVRPHSHPLAVRWRTRMIGGRMLDAACGRGRGIAAAGHLFHTIYGVDLSEVAIEQAGRIWVGNQYQFIVGDVAAQQWPADHFGLTCAFGFTDFQFFKQARAALRPGGMFLYEGFSRKQLTANPDLDPAWTATHADLLATLPGWTVLESGESADPPFLLRLAALRPATG